jgi:hypothetical protein
MRRSEALSPLRDLEARLAEVVPGFIPADQQQSAARVAPSLDSDNGEGDKVCQGIQERVEHVICHGDGHGRDFDRETVEAAGRAEFASWIRSLGPNSAGSGTPDGGNFRRRFYGVFGRRIGNSLVTSGPASGGSSGVRRYQGQ